MAFVSVTNTWTYVYKLTRIFNMAYTYSNRCNRDVTRKIFGEVVLGWGCFLGGWLVVSIECGHFSTF